MSKIKCTIPLKSEDEEATGKKLGKNKGGRPVKFTFEYCETIFDDFVEKNPNAEITPNELSKWSLKSIYRDETKGEIPRTVWYKDEWQQEIRRFNQVGYVVNPESINEIAGFNVEKFFEKYNIPVKAQREIRLFVERVNKAAEIAYKSQAKIDQLEKYKEENDNLKSRLFEEKKKVDFYIKKVESLTYDSSLKTSRIKNRIKDNVLTFEGKSYKQIEDELSLQNIAKSVTLSEGEAQLDIDEDVLALLEEYRGKSNE